MPSPFWAVVRSLPQRERFALAANSACAASKHFCRWSRPSAPPRRCSIRIFSCAHRRAMAVDQFLLRCIVSGSRWRLSVENARRRDRKYQINDRRTWLRAPARQAAACLASRVQAWRHVIIGGPFEGVRAIHSEMRAGDCERILLSLLGSSARPVMVPSHQVVPSMTEAR